MVTARTSQLPDKMCIPQLVSSNAIDSQATALVAGDVVLTYRELSQRANQLAHYLQTLGVRSNTLVGCCIERSIDMVVTLLGILKAGGAYVPLDPTYPSERLNFMLADAGVSVLVTRQSLARELAIQTKQMVYLDSQATLLQEQQDSDPVVEITADDLAYVIYTSGSTGQPKGVQITHHSLLNLISWHQQNFSVTAADRATQVTSPAFDATGWELWPYLTIGASIYFPNDETRMAPTLLRDWLVRNKITITFLPTLLAESMIALEWPSTTALRLLLTGADTLRHYPPATLPFELVNNYGPTEATVVATSGKVVPTPEEKQLPSIGRPITNTEVYILDENMQKVPAGEIGELYIGGAGLAVGYLNRPELTRERFIDHPFSEKPGARLYRTGDLGYYLPDGQIAFVGRADDQVKIRGYRIELDEIALALNRHPAIQTSTVVANEDSAGNRRLVAYLVLAPGTQVTARALREELGERLPDYMLPAIYVVVEDLPLSPNGKLDRTALPAPDPTNMLRDEEETAPTTLIEEQLVDIIASLLGLERIGIDDDFFMLGGHSLLGTQVIARVSETFDVNLTLRTLFDAPTVRELAAVIEQHIIAKLEAMSEEEAQLLLEQEHRV